jgi:hypothetical protein
VNIDGRERRVSRFGHRRVCGTIDPAARAIEDIVRDETMRTIGARITSLELAPPQTAQ